MHVKCMILDEKVLLQGSVNLTHNGMENNKEHLYRITDQMTVTEVLDDFELEWAGAEKDTVTEQVIQKMNQIWTTRSDTRRQRSQSRSAERQQSRSTRNLSHDLASVSEGPVDSGLE